MRLLQALLAATIITQIKAQAGTADTWMAFPQNASCSPNAVIFEFTDWQIKFLPPPDNDRRPEETQEQYDKRVASLMVKVASLAGTLPAKDQVVYHFDAFTGTKGFRELSKICLTRSAAIDFAESSANDTFDVLMATKTNSDPRTFDVLPSIVFKNQVPFQNVIPYHSANQLYDVQMTITQKCPPQRFGYLCQSVCDCDAADCDIRDGCKSSLLFWILFAVIIAIINICLILCGVYIWLRLRKNRKNGKGKIGQYRPNEVVDVGRTPPRQSADHDGPVFFTTDDQDHVSGIYHARPAIAGSVSSGDRF
ncbi:unnamed protein product, partial [Mesorhabditis spiculigera]